MLTITTRQSAAFDREQRYRLALRLLMSLQRQLPEQWPAAQSADARRAHIDSAMTAVDAAIDQGFEDDDAIARFAQLWSLVDNLGATAAHEQALDMLDDDTIATGWPETRALLVALCDGSVIDAAGASEPEEPQP